MADIQDRLLELGFWLTAASGADDDTTLHAVTAFEKLHGLERDGALSIDDLRVLELAPLGTPVFVYDD